MDYLGVKNWTEFQHYKDRNPPWIKLHRALLDDYEFGRLQDASKLHLMLIWLFASQNGGRVPADPKFLQAKLSLDKQPDLNTLVEQGFLIPEQGASTPLADCYHDDSTVLALARSREKRREEERREELERFARFWQAYPRKIAKPVAVKSWEKLKPDEPLLTEILAAIERARVTEQWLRDEGKFIPHPATWLNQRRWEDQVDAAPRRMVM